MLRLKELRESKGIEQKEIASVLSVSQPTVSDWETGRKMPSSKNTERLADFFGVTVDYLLGRDNLSDLFSIPGIMPLPKMKKVPRLGTIACGKPILAVENIEEFDEVPEDIHCDFTLTCKGDSMIGARILDGDIVYIRQQPEVEDGEIAAVIIGDEVTLKRVRHAPNKIVLWPENPKYEPFVYQNGDLENIRIIGKAVFFRSIVI